MSTIPASGRTVEAYLTYTVDGIEVRTIAFLESA